MGLYEKVGLSSEVKRPIFPDLIFIAQLRRRVECSS